MLSTDFLFPPGSDPESPRSTTEYDEIVAAKLETLRRQSERIKGGQGPQLDEDLVAEMVRDHTKARRQMRRHWFSFSMIVALLVLPFILALLGWLIILVFRPRQ